MLNLEDIKIIAPVSISMVALAISFINLRKSIHDKRRDITLSIHKIWTDNKMIEIRHNCWSFIERKVSWEDLGDNEDKYPNYREAYALVNILSDTHRLLAFDLLDRQLAKTLLHDMKNFVKCMRVHNCEWPNKGAFSNVWELEEMLSENRRWL